MSRRIALLAFTVVVFASLVVEMRHRNRDEFAELQRLTTQRDTLDTEWGKLLLEEGTWSQHRRVEAIARTRLGMATPKAGQVVVLDLRSRGDKS
jgi:cell division protein FtsL